MGNVKTAISLNEAMFQQNVSQIFTVDKSDLGEKIGTLSARRLREILQGIGLVLQHVSRLEDEGDMIARGELE